MSGFQLITKWSLRALLLWGAFEVGATIYDEAMLRSSQASQLSGHAAAMARINENARALEAEAQAARGATQTARAWRLQPGGAAQDVTAAATQELRDDLLAMGAQAPEVQSATRDDGSVSLTTQWREPEGAPPLFHALAQRRPFLTVQRLRMLPIEGVGLVSVEAVFVTRVQRGAP